MPRFSICILTFKRTAELQLLWDSIVAQDFEDYEVVCCDDSSPEPFKTEKRALAERYAPLFGGRLRFIENPENLGYDKNFRTTIDHARGDYCVMMGDDDLMAPGALRHFNDMLVAHPEAGFILRSYSTFTDVPEAVVQVHRYYPSVVTFQPGTAAMTALFHRSVLISGLLIRRDCALRHRTDRVDGTLYYQLYIIAMTLAHAPAAGSPQVVVYNRLIGPEKSVFGNSASELGFWTPGKRSVDSSVYQIRQYLKVGQIVQEDSGLPVYEGIRDEVSKYSYAFLVYHADKGVRAFLAYARELFRIGMGREPYFYIYVLGLLILRPKGCNWLIAQIKTRLGRTPQL